MTNILISTDLIREEPRGSVAVQALADVIVVKNNDGSWTVSKYRSVMDLINLKETVSEMLRELRHDG